MTRIVIACFDAGGGHRAAAQALVAAIHQQNRPWRTEILNVDDVLEPVDPIFRLTGVRGAEFYNWSLRRGWTVGSSQMIAVMHCAIRVLHKAQVRLLRKTWRELRPDLVISVIPHFNRALFESLRAEAPHTPFVTILTDFADHPPHFWFELQDQHFICGSGAAVEQARALGMPEDRACRVSGMILHPRFYEPMRADKEDERRKIGLDPRRKTGVVSFGGNGCKSMVEIARRLEAASESAQYIFLCGRNRSLAERLRELKVTYPIHVQEFTESVAHYMWLSDFFIGKPGPGSISEALAMGLPVVVKAGAGTLAQERYNVQWIREQRVGIAIERLKDLPGAVDLLLYAPTFVDFRERIRALQNFALFETLAVIDRLQGAADARAGAAHARASFAI